MDALEELEHGRLRSFSDWPDEGLRVSSPGVYVVWRGSDFLYVGISWQDRPGSKGLFGRLDSHASGRRSGDQFCIYVCDRFIVPSLNPEQLRKIGEGQLSLDRMTREFIRGELTYRATHTATGSDARAIEATIRSTGLPNAGQPLLNPARSAMRP